METISEFTEDIVLELQDYAYARAYSMEVPVPRIYVDNDIETGITRLAMVHKIPGKVLQDRTEICRYPASNWDWIKSFIPGLKPKYKVHCINEHLTFPSIKIPEPELKDQMRIYIEPSSYLD